MTSNPFCTFASLDFAANAMRTNYCHEVVGEIDAIVRTYSRCNNSNITVWLFRFNFVKRSKQVTHIWIPPETTTVTGTEWPGASDRDWTSACFYGSPVSCWVGVALRGGCSTPHALNVMLFHVTSEEGGFVAWYSYIQCSHINVVGEKIFVYIL